MNIFFCETGHGIMYTFSSSTDLVHICPFFNLFSLGNVLPDSEGASPQYPDIPLQIPTIFLIFCYLYVSRPTASITSVQPPLHGHASPPPPPPPPPSIFHSKLSTRPNTRPPLRPRVPPPSPPPHRPTRGPLWLSRHRHLRNQRSWCC